MISQLCYGKINWDKVKLNIFLLPNVKKKKNEKKKLAAEEN